MSLPELTIPFELPIDVPVLLHPAVVHFAIALPIVVILLEFINLFFRKKALSVFSLFLIMIIAVVMAGAYFSGVTDGQEAFSQLSSAGKEELKEHKMLGIYLVYGSAGLFVLKTLFMPLSGAISRLFFIILLVGFTAVTLKQGHEGGDLVYKYGANSEAVANVISDKEDLQEEFDELKESCEESKGSEEAKTEEEATTTEEPSSEEGENNSSN